MTLEFRHPRVVRARAKWLLDYYRFPRHQEPRESLTVHAHRDRGEQYQLRPGIVAATDCLVPVRAETLVLNTTGSQLITAFGPCDAKVASGDPFTDGSTPVFRGTYNKDGSPCPPAWYNSTTDLANKKVSLQVDPNQPAAVFVADITWNPDFVDPATGLPKLTQVAWDQHPSFVAGRSCISPDLPAPYGTLADPGITTASQTSIQTTSTVVFATTPSVTAPIPVIVDTERMNVIGQSGTTLTVQRGQGGTAAVSHTPNTYPNTTLPKLLMRTPFPLDANGIVMQVCIAIREQ